MMVLNRSYREANMTERYRKLYRIGKMADGGYKTQEIRLMENGLFVGFSKGITNIIKYFLSWSYIYE